MSNPPYCLPYNLCDFSLENLELDQPIIPKLIKFSYFSSLVHFILYCNNVRTNFVWVTGGQPLTPKISLVILFLLLLLLYSSCDVSLEDLVLDHLIIP